MLLMHIQLILRFQAMASLLGDASGGFENDCVVWYECKPELFAKIDG